MNHPVATATIWSLAAMLIGGILISMPLAAEDEFSPPTSPAAALDQTDADNAAVTDPEEKVEKDARASRCIPRGNSGAWIDKLQRGVHRTVCGTAVWFDDFFGDVRYEQPLDENYGRLGVGFEWDERDGFEPSLRLRAKLDLPAFKQRVGLLIGRGDEDQLIEDRPGSTRDALPSSVRDVDDDDWLVGLGYSRDPGARKGFDFRIGARLNLPVEPYAKGIWRWGFDTGPRSELRLRETVFWREDRGFGATTHVDIDRLLGERSLLRWTEIATIAEDVDGFEWESSMSLYRNLSKRRAIAYTTLFRGETQSPVPVRNYGFEVRYRQRVVRNFLFIELLTSLTWPREFPEERREPNFGVGIGFEMYFGRVPEHAMF